MESSTHVLYPGPQNDTLQEKQTNKQKMVYEEVLLSSLGDPEVNKNTIWGTKMLKINYLLNHGGESSFF